MACRRGPAVPCAVCGNRAERRRTTGGSRAATLRRRAANERALGRRVTRTGTPTRQSNPTIARIAIFIRQIVPHLTRSRPPNGTGNTRSGRSVWRIRRTPVIHLRLRLDARTRNGRRAMNGQRPKPERGQPRNATGRVTGGTERLERSRERAPVFAARGGGISIFTLQLSFLGH